MEIGFKLNNNHYFDNNPSENESKLIGYNAPWEYYLNKKIPVKITAGGLNAVGIVEETIFHKDEICVYLRPSIVCLPLEKLILEKNNSTSFIIPQGMAVLVTPVGNLKNLIKK